jgi:hypothetical protein
MEEFKKDVVLGNIKELRVLEHRKVGELDGQEALVQIREQGYMTYDFGWEMQGKLQDLYAPWIMVEMSRGIDRGAHTKPTLSEDALIKLWDGVLDSLRVRPTTPTSSQPGK